MARRISIKNDFIQDEYNKWMLNLIVNKDNLTVINKFVQ